MTDTDRQRLEKISDYCVKLLAFIEDAQVDREKLMVDYTVQWTVTTPLYNIGEHVYYLSSDFKDSHTDIPWSMISGLRHRLVHNYDGTNWSIIADVVYEELPGFKNQVDCLLNED